MNPLRTGHMKLLGSGREFYGTVIKDGINKKTCTVNLFKLRLELIINFLIKNIRPGIENQAIFKFMMKNNSVKKEIKLILINDRLW